MRNEKEEDTKENIGTKEWSASAIGTGVEKERPTFGEMHIAYEQLAELPSVGSWIKLYEPHWLTRDDNAARSRTKRNKDININIDKYSYLTPPEDCVTIRGDEKIFEVIRYTQGIDGPFLLNNHMVLRCIYPDYVVGQMMTIPARFMAVKNIRYVVVPGWEGIL